MYPGLERGWPRPLSLCAEGTRSQCRELCGCQPRKLPLNYDTAHNGILAHTCLCIKSRCINRERVEGEGWENYLNHLGHSCQEAYTSNAEEPGDGDLLSPFLSLVGWISHRADMSQGLKLCFSFNGPTNSHVFHLMFNGGWGGGGKQQLWSVPILGNLYFLKELNINLNLVSGRTFACCHYFPGPCVFCGTPHAVLHPGCRGPTNWEWNTLVWENWFHPSLDVWPTL